MKLDLTLKQQRPRIIPLVLDFERHGIDDVMTQVCHSQKCMDEICFDCCQRFAFDEKRDGFFLVGDD